tara:strand:- start:716 stop:1792 length:1077 start_codon:yes stop_codon:yes gene_type:complete
MTIIPPNPCLEASLELNKLGIKTIPIRNKIPTIKGWNQYSDQSKRGLKKMFEKPDVDMAIRTDNLTVVDCDDENTLADAETLYGKSPFITRTPRGGGHLYFKNDGETSDTQYLRKKNLNIDIKAGQGAYCVEPASKGYSIERGSYLSLLELPTMVPYAPLKPRDRNLKDQRISGRIRDPQKAKKGSDSPVAKDGRNTELFRHARELAHRNPHIKYKSLSGACYELNRAFDPPMDDWEVENVVNSTWKYKQDGKILVAGGEATSLVTKTLLKEFSGNPDALVLYLFLQQSHSNGRQFAIAGEAMAEHNCLHGWTRKRYTKATKDLITMGRLIRTSQGKVFKPHMYLLGTQCNKTVLSGL